ncbi:hypothetical protein SAMN04487884_11293 [Butyrivibrio fibrisolvens]|uniref:Lipoprotein n=1 Tax=Butyrivibrio fibrisolvens TaxID=831 RepID=A0A1H9SLU3_BUTFI|nr:hypothetical protein [Butyrivibrio fibrisolvens]SER85695.1 hypothetical protein SAMN04487884_11293 [Butyrivibrio fibrisolvens]
MKKMNKKVVIATTLGIASMVLTAACGYGPATYEPDEDDSSYENTISDDTDNENNKNSGNDVSSLDYTKEDYPEPEPEDVYGHPVVH